MKIPLKDILFVLFQFLLILAFAFDFDVLSLIFPAVLFWIGLVLFISGSFTTVVAVLHLNIHLSPFPSPLPDAKLIETGIYKLVRHPIYTGLILAFYGYAVITDSGYRLLIATLLFVLFYIKSLYEEQRLIEKFPNYTEYKKRSGRFFPGL